MKIWTVLVEFAIIPVGTYERIPWTFIDIPTMFTIISQLETTWTNTTVTSRLVHTTECACAGHRVAFVDVWGGEEYNWITHFFCLSFSVRFRQKLLLFYRNSYFSLKLVNNSKPKQLLSNFQACFLNSCNSRLKWYYSYTLLTHCPVVVRLVHKCSYNHHTILYCRCMGNAWVYATFLDQYSQQV